MISLDVLVIGDFSLDADGNVAGAYSTSTLIRADGMNIVVDASAPCALPAIKTSFRQIGIYPSDVDAVILTHSHEDHIGNLSLYPKAKVYIHEAEAIPGAEPLKGGEGICKGVKTMHTPGHTPGSMSVLASSDLRYALAGDAIPRHGNYIDMKPPRICYDEGLALKSIKEISKHADVIVPGHDPPFAVR